MKFELRAAGYCYNNSVEVRKAFFSYGLIDLDHGLPINEDVFIDIDSMAQLEKIQDDFNAELIIDFKDKQITIYNDYIE